MSSFRTRRLTAKSQGFGVRDRGAIHSAINTSGQRGGRFGVRGETLEGMGLAGRKRLPAN